MNEDGAFFALVWKLCIGFLCVLIVTIGSCTAYTHKLISGHADPISAACAMSTSRVEICVAAAAKRAQQ